MGVNFDWNSERAKEKNIHYYPNYSTNAANLVSDQKFENHLKWLSNKRAFDQNDFDKGIAYFESGLTLDELDNIRKSNRSFISGFKHAQRLAVIKEIEQKEKTR